MNATEKALINRILGDFRKLFFAVVLIVIREFTPNETIKIILLILSVGFLGPVLYQIGTFYFFKYKPGLTKYKRGILFTTLLIIILIIYYSLYLYEGGFTGLFFGVSIPSFIGYLIALVVTYSK